MAISNVDIGEIQLCGTNWSDTFSNYVILAQLPEGEVVQMCKEERKKECAHPEKLKGKPGECSPEQIKECHGETMEHPCVEAK